MAGFDITARGLSAFPRFRVPRHVAILGGTTTLEDCAIALRYLADPLHMIEGDSISEYEHAFSRKIGVRHAISFSCARVGLFGLLRALEVGSGDEVLLQVPTHITIPNAIRFGGARPVYVDCRLEDYNMDLELAERQITPRTRVLLLQHTFGIPVDLDAALALASRHGLEIIEDCVHALGARYNGKPVGSFGRASIFSTEETKTISTTMGGMVVTDDTELAVKMRAFQRICGLPSRSLVTRYMVKLLAYHVLTEPHLHRLPRAMYEFIGRQHPLPRPTSGEESRGLRPANYERLLSNAQAAVGVSQLRGLEANLAHRSMVAAEYRERLTGLGFPVPEPSAKATPAFVRYPVWVEDRPAVLHAASPHATLGTWFTSVLEEATTPSCGQYEIGSCPNAEAAAQHLVNLPTHPRICKRDIAAIVSALAIDTRLSPT
jgi:perosamine synthetase